MANERLSGQDKGQAKEPTIFNTVPSELMEGFRKAVLGNAVLQAKVREARSAGDLVRIAAQHGFGVSEEEVHAVLSMAAKFNLGEVELEGTHLGLPCWCDPSVVNTKSCGPGGIGINR
jgi:predicted ribosomally synthesized peptide with nif11-like leader